MKSGIEVVHKMKSRKQQSCENSENRWSHLTGGHKGISACTDVFACCQLMSNVPTYFD